MTILNSENSEPFKLRNCKYTTGLYNNKLSQKFSELIKTTHRYISHSPRYAQYSTGKHLILLTWQLHDLIVECNYKKFKKTSLRDLDITLEKLRSMWSLLKVFWHIQNTLQATTSL